MTKSVPWWRIATLALLVAAFIVSVSSGRTIEAVIIGFLALPTLALLLVGAWIYERAPRRPSSPERASKGAQRGPP
jgi:choline-glycine betaine transporter